MENITIENVDIPIKSDNINLKGSIYFSSKTPPKGKWIINLPGAGDTRESYFSKVFSEKFALAGFYVLSYDYRAHGETAKQTGKNIFKHTPAIFTDIKEVISWILSTQSERLLEDKIALFGRSFGGAIILTQGFLDKRAKILIALCTRYDYHSLKIKYPEDIIQKISPIYFLKNDPQNNERILIAHCENDDQIPFNNIFQIKEHLGLDDENVITYEGGSHAFRDHREQLFERVLEFLKRL